MTNEQPQLNMQGRYTVRETCDYLGISRETLRRHTIKGHIKVKYRRSNGRPYYIGSDILTFWRISY